MQLTLDVNGGLHHVDVAADRRLVDVLRYDLGLLGTKLACGEGACGACAVILDGRAVASCILLAAAAEGHEIRTIEGLSLGSPSPLHEAFVAEDALQCGFCTPGQVVTATALLERSERPTAGEIRAAMAGNLCRCGAYPKIQRAIELAAEAGA